MQRYYNHKLLPEIFISLRILLIAEPGELQFDKLPKVYARDEKVTVKVIRQHGIDGEISVKWKTNENTAKDNIDYKGGSGVLTFLDGMVRAIIINMKLTKY